jgi:hypothetical protein
LTKADGDGSRVDWEVRARDVGALQICARNRRRLQVGTPKTGARKVCAGEIGCIEVSALQIGARKICAAERRTGKPGAV